MLRHIVLGAMAFLAGSAGLALAAPKDDALAAIQKLSDSPNYSWTSTVENAGGGGFGAGASQGKTQKDGYTTFSITMRQNEYTAFIKGDKSMLKTADGWKLTSDLMSADAGGGFNPDMFAAMRVQTFKAPAAQAQDAIAKLDALKADDDAFSSDLSEDAVKAMLSFRPRNPAADAPPPPDITNAKGSVKVWIKDGALSKIAYHVQGTISFNGNDRDIDRTTTVEIKDVGSTTIDVPDEVKAKLP